MVRKHPAYLTRRDAYLVERAWEGRLSEMPTLDPQVNSRNASLLVASAILGLHALRPQGLRQVRCQGRVLRRYIVASRALLLYEERPDAAAYKLLGPVDKVA